MDTNLLYRQVNRLLLPPPGAHAVPTPIACLAFDNSYELLWSGNDFGRVTSFYGTELTQYISFKAGDDPVRQILLHDKGVIALCSKCIHMAMRRGPPIWHITYNTQVLKLLQG
jgi:PAB-dependent poly(A)-specific ribonuclease subunit 2